MSSPAPTVPPPPPFPRPLPSKQEKHFRYMQTPQSQHTDKGVRSEHLAPVRSKVRRLASTPNGARSTLASMVTRTRRMHLAHLSRPVLRKQVCECSLYDRGCVRKANARRVGFIVSHGHAARTWPTCPILCLRMHVFICSRLTGVCAQGDCECMSAL